MNKADKMFEELGYRKVIDNEYEIDYRNKRKSHIYFKKIDKSLDLASHDIKNKILPLEQLTAIIEKCKELGWIE